LSIPSSYLRDLPVPSAIVSDGVVAVPLWAVTTVTLSQTYHLPAIGSSGARAIATTHDDTISLSGVLVGDQRYAWKLDLENLADVGRRGSALAAATGGRASGLVLVTSMTIRTDMHVQSVSFTASAARRDVLDVSMTLAHLPLPGALGKLLDIASLGVAALADWKRAQ
jgi:hypothetical protein